MKFRSKFEETVYKAAKKSRKNLEYETLKVPYTWSVNYIPDFILPNGIIVEAKGYFPPRDRAKMGRVKKCNPSLDIRFVFQNASVKLNKNSKVSYGDWAKKNGFEFAEGLIPLEWWKEKGTVSFDKT